MSDPDFARGALDGVRVLDLSRVVAGPYIGRILADLGADVVKVEPPEGDQVRQIAPKHDRGMSALFTFANLGKRGVCLDLKQAAGREVVLDLVRVSDAVLENFRPGVLDRLGLDWETIHAANPRTILVSVNGYGADSEWRDRMAYAPIMHAITGIMHDQSEYAGHPVAQRNEAHADTIASLHAAVALLAALRVAERTGRGQRIEVPMFDAVLATYTEANNALLTTPDDRIMNPIYDAGPHGVIATAGPAHYVWALVVRAHPELSDPAPPGSDIPTKLRLRRPALEDWMASQPSREAVLEKLAAAGIACAPVVPILEALTGPLARERDLLVAIDDRRGGTRPVVRSPARFSESGNRIRGGAPRRGEHNREILGGLLGYDDARIRALEENAVISRGDPDEG